MYGRLSKLFISKVASSAPRARPSKGPELPRSGMRSSPFASFVKEEYNNNPNKTSTDKMKDLAAQWKNMDVDKKEKFFKLSKDVAEEKRRNFLKLSTEEQEALVQKAKEKKAEQDARKKLKERREKNKLEERPTQVPNAYALFVKEKLTGCKTDVREKLKELIAEWKTMGHVEKQKYTDEANKLTAEYQANLEKWLAEQKAKTDMEKKSKVKEAKDKKPMTKEGHEKKAKAHLAN